MAESNRAFHRTVLHTVLGAVALVCGLHGATASAQTAFPTKPITIVVPFAAGGPTDASARVVAKVMSTELGQSVIVDNRVGAGGTIGSAYVARSPADGYMLLWGGTSSLAVAPALYPKAQFDPVKSFVPIGMATRGPMLLAGRADFPPQTAKDLVAYTRANKVSMGSGGTGTLSHLAGEYFQELTKAQMLHVPYRGGAPALNDLLGGQIDVVFDNASFLLPHVKAGKLKPYAVTGLTRYSAMPDVPTVAEVFGGDFQVYSWFGLVAPAGTPQPVVAALSAAMSKVETDVEAKRALTAAGLEAVSTTPEDFARTIAADNRKWAGIVARAKVRVED